MDDEDNMLEDIVDYGIGMESSDFERPEDPEDKEMWPLTHRTEVEGTVWHLTINEKNSWEGVGTAAPPASFFDAAFADTSGLSPRTLATAAATVIRSAPEASIVPLLSRLATAFMPGARDDKLEAVLSDTRGRRAICGRIFDKDDIIWNCVECGLDETCVQCDACFNKSDHEGHQVFFHQSGSSGLGCCDCGDPDAWRGGCRDHGNCACGDDGDTEVKPLPHDFLRGFRPVLEAVVGILTSTAVCSARGLEHYAKESGNQYMKVKSIIPASRRTPFILPFPTETCIHLYFVLSSP